MHKHKDLNFIRKVIKAIESGASVENVAKEYEVPKSTIYRWIDEYSEYKTEAGSFTYRDYQKINNELQKYHKMLDILQRSPFLDDKRTIMYYMEHLLKINEASCKNLSARLLCEAFGVDHSTFMNHLYRNKKGESENAKKRDELTKDIIKIYGESGGTIGPKKMHRILLNKKYSFKVGIGIVRDIMKSNGLKAKPQKSTKRAMTLGWLSRKRNKEDLLKEDFSAEAPNLKWVSDIKEIYCKNRKYYLCVVIDLFSRRAISYRIRNRESTYLVTQTIKDALESRVHSDKLIFHSDRGTQYTSYGTNKLLRRNGIIHSYSRVKMPPDNGVAESFFSHFSREELSVVYYNRPYGSEKDMRERIDKYIHQYNYKRPHEYNDGETPVHVEADYRRRYKAKIVTPTPTE